MQTSRISIITILFAISWLTPAVLGQKKPPLPQKPSHTSQRPDQPDPNLQDFGFIVSLDVEGEATVSIQVDGASDKIRAQELSGIYDYFSLQKIKRNAHLATFNPGIIIKAATTLEFGKIVDFIKPLRRSGDSRIKIAIGDHDFLIVPARTEPTRLINVKPNPLTLLVQLERSGFIAINNEQIGAIGDPQSTQNRLSDIFKARKENGVFRVGTNELESTVCIKVSPNRPFSDVEKLVGTIRRAGSDFIFLYFESDEPSVVMERK